MAKPKEPKEWGTKEELLAALNASGLVVPSIQNVYWWRRVGTIQFKTRTLDRKARKGHRLGMPPVLYPIREIFTQVRELRTKQEEGRRIAEIAEEARDAYDRQVREDFLAALPEVQSILKGLSKESLSVPEYVDRVLRFIGAHMRKVEESRQAATDALNGGNMQASRWFQSQAQAQAESLSPMFDLLTDAEDKVRQLKEALPTLQAIDPPAALAAIEEEKAQSHARWAKANDLADAFIASQTSGTGDAAGSEPDKQLLAFQPQPALHRGEPGVSAKRKRARRKKR